MYTRIVYLISLFVLFVPAAFSAAAGENPQWKSQDNGLSGGLTRFIKSALISAINNPDTSWVEEYSVFRGLNYTASGSFADVSIASYNSSDYFPLYPGAFWEYTVDGSSKDTMKVLPEQVKVNGTMTSVVRCKCGDKEYYTSDSNGVSLHRLFYPNLKIPGLGSTDVTATFDPPLQVGPDTIDIGQLIVSNGNVIFYYSLVNKRVSVSYSATYQFESVENINVPAGNFDVLKISGSLDIADQAILQTFYLAENVGIVKQITDGTTEELTAFFYVNFLSPSEDEVILPGSTYTINWEASPDTAYFSLLYSTDNGTKWKTITPDLVTGTSYDWAVPLQKNNRTSCFIKIIGYNSYGIKKTSVTSKPFAIEVVKLTSPDGGEVLTSSTSWPIVWNTNATKTPVASVVLKYTLNQGRTWKTLANIAGGDPGTYDWNIPAVSKEKTKCRVQVILKDANGRTIGTDMSDDVFTISP